MPEVKFQFGPNTVQKMKFLIKDFSSDQIRRKL